MIAFTVEVEVRLVNGSTKYEGRVEVLYNGQWGTVCDDGWDLNDAEVMCRQLGFGPTIAARHYAAYGQGRGKIWLDDLNCVGTESNIGHCLHRGWGNYYCSHYEDAGIKCADSHGKVYVDDIVVNNIVILQTKWQFVFFLHTQSIRVEWKCITMVNGVQCVIMNGI